MKKSYWLSRMIVLSAVVGVNTDVIASEINKNPGKLSEKQRNKLELLQWNKIERQRELARPAIYTMVDAAIKEGPVEYKGEKGKEILVENPIIVNWPVIFNILDSMGGVISVNEYRTYNRLYPLLYVAIREGNLLATKTLLEKYNANPNSKIFVYADTLAEAAANEEMEETTPLMLARKQGNNAMVNLLINKSLSLN